MARAATAAAKAKASAGSARRNSWGSTDDGDVQVLSSSSRRASGSGSAPTTIDPAGPLFARLLDSISPFRTQIEQSRKRAAEDPTYAASVAAAATSSSTRRSTRRNTTDVAATEDDVVDISRSEQQDGEERKVAAAGASVPISSLSTLKVSHKSATATDAGGESEAKEQQADDATMHDASSSSASAAAAAPEEKSQEVSAYLRVHGPALLRDFVLLSILESPGHKLSPKALEAALERTPHLPRAFVHWAILSDVDAPSVADDPSEETGDEAMAGDNGEESKQAPASASAPAAAAEHVAQSPLELCLALLCSSGMLHKPASLRASADSAYRATAAALESRHAAESVRLRTSMSVPGQKRTGRGQRTAAQVAQAAEMRSLKLQFALKQNAFIEAHKDVFGPFITNKAERAKHNLPPLSLDASSVGRSDEENLHHKPYVFPGAIYPAPKSIHNAELMRPYQLKGMSFLAHLHDNGAGAILGDEMGLGQKTDIQHNRAWGTRAPAENRKSRSVSQCAWDSCFSACGFQEKRFRPSVSWPGCARTAV